MKNPDLLLILERSATIEERSGPAFETAVSAGDRQQQLLEQWKKNAAASNPQWFSERLTWCGLDADSLTKLTGPVRYIGGDSLPQWTQLLEELCQFCECAPEPDQGHGVPTEPFQPIYDVWIAFAAARLDWSSDRLTATAVASLKLLLRDRINQRCFPVLRDEGKDFAAALSVLPLSVRDSGFDPEVYWRFICRITANGGRDFFRAFPVLARTLCIVLQNWIDFAGEFLTRLDRDWTLLNQLGWFPLASSVSSIMSSAADVHARGRAVLILTLDNHSRIVYKPRDIELDAIWHTAVSWVNIAGGFSLRAARAVNRTGYGWVEFIAGSECSDDAGRARFFERGGAFLALVYALNGQDFHSDNVIHAGEHPVLIDVEGLFRTPPCFMVRPELSESDPGLECRDGYGVQHTALLPMGFRSGGNFGGLWKKSTGSEMEALDFATGQAEQVISGFRRMYRCLMEHRTELSDLFELRSGKRILQRFLFRNTELYSEILRKLSVRSMMVDSANMVPIIDSLARAFLVYGFAERFRGILKAEQRSLFDSDIPIFASSLDSRSLVTDDGTVIERAFEQTPAEHALRHIERLSEEDMERQIQQIRSSLALPALNLACRSVFAPFGISGGEMPNSSKSMNCPRLSELIDTVLSYSRNRLNNIVNYAGNSQRAIRWTFSFVSPSSCYDQPDVALTLFDGFSGVALFAAAVQSRGNSSAASEILRGLSEILNQTFISGLRQFVRLRGISALTGFCGISYAAAHAGRILNRRELIDSAIQALSVISDEDFSRMQSIELYGGLAGVISVLCTLAEISGDLSLLERACQLGERVVTSPCLPDLLQDQLTLSRTNRPVLGLATGAAGTGLAILRLARMTHRDDFDQCGRSLIAADVRRFARKSVQEMLQKLGLLNSSSFGTPGLGAVLGLLESKGIVIDCPLDIRRSETESVVDQVCVGELGRIEPYLCSPGPENDFRAAEIITAFLRRFFETGRERCFLPGVFDEVHPGLFQGISGIGYQLIRSQDPVKFKSFLLLE
jgi:lantibiotic modifying enzyme